MYKKLLLGSLVILSIIFLMGCNMNSEIKVNGDGKTYYFPHEGAEHEGTWLQWPHNKTYQGTIDVYDPIWIEMTRGLVKGENVHLIVYDEQEKARVKKVLQDENIDMSRVDFYVFPTDDVWVRDNGPIFAYDQDNKLVIQNWQFNGWGNKAPFEKDNLIPTKVSEAIGIPKVDIDMVMEGGALELDGKGTCISTLSCVNNNNRTKDFTIDEIEAYLTKYYGVTNFIWLEGEAGMDITDNHIDGVIKIYDETTIITTSEYDPESPKYLKNDPDAKTLLSAKNANGEEYEFVYLPETKNNVVKVQGEWMKGSYMNFYVANKVVLVPNYNDENDKVANEILSKLYPNREIVGIDVRDLFADGGMIHCVTQQQPVANPVAKND